MKSFDETMASIFMWIAAAAGGGASIWLAHQPKEPITLKKMKKDNHYPQK